MLLLLRGNEEKGMAWGLVYIRNQQQLPKAKTRNDGTKREGKKAMGCGVQCAVFWCGCVQARRRMSSRPQDIF